MIVLDYPKSEVTQCAQLLNCQCLRPFHKNTIMYSSIHILDSQQPWCDIIVIDDIIKVIIIVPTGVS